MASVASRRLSDVAEALVLVGIGGAAAYAGLSYRTPDGFGPGLAPLLIGAALAMFGLLELVSTSYSPAEAQTWPAGRLLYVGGATAALVFLMHWLTFMACIAIFAVALAAGLTPRSRHGVPFAIATLITGGIVLVMMQQVFGISFP